MSISLLPTASERECFVERSAYDRHRWSAAVPGAFLAIFLAAAGCLLARDLRDSTVRDTQAGLHALATLLADQADRALDAAAAVEDGLADGLVGATSGTDQEFARRASSLESHERLATSVAALPQLRSITVVNRSGAVLASSQAESTPYPSTVVDPMRGPVDTSIDRTTIVTSPGLSEVEPPAVRLSRRVYGPDGTTFGYILAAVDLHYFEKLYAAVPTDEADVISMVSEDRVMLARQPSPPGAIGRVVPPIVGLRRLPTEPDGSGVGRVTTPIDGRDRLIATRRLDHHPFIVGASRTADAALSAWRRQAVAIATAVAMLVIGLALVLRANTRRIRAQASLATSEAARSTMTARMEGERRLREEYARFGRALDGMGQGVCLFDVHGEALFVNSRLTALLGLPQGLDASVTSLDGLLDHLRRIMPPTEGAAFAAGLGTAAAASGPLTLACTLSDGRILGVSVLRAAGGDLVCTFEDETERRRVERTVAHLAHHDALTGLPNRRLLKEAVERLLTSPERRRAGALLLLDLDGFKRVNDVHGHPFGDALLRSVADRLRSAMGEGDILARLGGDEFAIVCGVNAGLSACQQPGDSIALAAHVAATMRAPFVIDGTSVPVGTSVGIALPTDGDAERLMCNADAALYRAKAAGRGAWHLFGTHAAAA